VIDLGATLFDWAKFRRTKGAIKLHCLLDHDGYLPSVVVITEGKRSDVRVARTLRFDPGTVVVMDRGYVDYAWFGQLTAQDVFFVTRLKDNILYQVVERRRVPERSAVRRDELIELTNWDAAHKCPFRLRRVEVDDPDQHGTLVFLTNQLAFGDQRQCLEGPGLDGAGRHPPAQVPATARPLRVVVVEPGCPLADESLYPSGSVGVAR
jgi:Transposase DDE domain